MDVADFTLLAALLCLVAAFAIMGFVRFKRASDDIDRAFDTEQEK